MVGHDIIVGHPTGDPMRVIDGKTYFDLVKYHPTEKFSNGITIAVIRQRYCRPMNIKGLCTSNCNNCAINIKNMNNKMRVAKDVRNPAALLTYIVRNEYSKMAENAYETKEAEVYTDALGERDDANPFDRLREEITT